MRFIPSLRIMAAILVLAAGLVLLVHEPALAQRGEVCKGVAIAGGGCDGGDAQISQLVRTVINILSLIAGIACVLVIIVSGIRLIVSAGDADGLKNARNGIVYAIIGLIVVAFAQVIVQFVLGRI